MSSSSFCFAVNFIWSTWTDGGSRSLRNVLDWLRITPSVLPTGFSGRFSSLQFYFCCSYFLVKEIKCTFNCPSIGKTGQPEAEHRVHVRPRPFCQTASEVWGTRGHRSGPEQRQTHDLGHQRALPDTQHSQVLKPVTSLCPSHVTLQQSFSSPDFSVRRWNNNRDCNFTSWIPWSLISYMIRKWQKSVPDL